MLTARCRTSKVGHSSEKKLQNAYVLQNVIFHRRESLGMRITCILHNFQNFLFCHVG